MRKPHKNWPDDRSLDGAIFFGQVVEELLNSTSLASYKSPTLTSFSRVEECLAIVDQVEKEEIRHHHLKPAVSELRKSLQVDSIAKGLIRPHFKWVQDMMSDIRQIESLKKALIFVKVRIGGQYFDEIVRSLRNEIERGVDKEKIYDLSKNLVSHLSYMGYSKSSIYERNRDFFLNANKKDLDNLFNSFITRYNFNTSRYHVYVRGNDVLCAASGGANSLFFAVEDNNLPKISKRKREKFFEKFSCTICIRENSLDARGAAQKADQTLSDINALTSLYAHSSKLNWSEAMIVCKENETRASLYETPKSEVQDVHEVSAFTPANITEQKIRLMARALQRDKGYEKLSSSLTGHATAIETTKPETQFITLWSALETILPSKSPYSSFDEYIGVIMPCLMCGYIWQTFMYFFQDLSNIYKSGFHKFLSQNGNNSVSMINLAQIVLLFNDSEKDKQQLLELVQRNPLARFRIRQLEKSFGSPKKVKRTLGEHHERVYHQLARIYRVRNGLVHGGEFVPYINPLGANLHEYFDTIMLNFDFHFSLLGMEASIDDVFESMKAQYESQWSLILYHTDAGNDLVSENMDEVLGFSAYQTAAKL